MSWCRRLASARAVRQCVDSQRDDDSQTSDVEGQLTACLDVDNFDDFVRLLTSHGRWKDDFLVQCAHVAVDTCRWRFFDALIDIPVVRDVLASGVDGQRRCVTSSTADDPVKVRSHDTHKRQTSLLAKLRQKIDTPRRCVEQSADGLPSWGERVLFQAAVEGQLKALEFLLQAGCNPNATFKTDAFPHKVSSLHVSVLTNNQPMAELLLLNKQTDVGLPYGGGADGAHRRGDSILHLACDADAHTMMRTILAHAPGLLEEPDASYCRTALQQAALVGCRECVTLLLEHGADVNAGNTSSADTDTSVSDVESTGARTPLMLAVSGGRRDVAEILLRHPGCNVNAVDTSSRMTAIHRAADRGDLDLVELLIEHGAHPNLSDSHGATPLSLAVNERHVDTARSLLRHIGQPDPDGKITRMVLERRLSELIEPLVNVGVTVPCDVMTALRPERHVTSEVSSLRLLAKVVTRRALDTLHTANTARLGLPAHLVDYLLSCD